MNYRRIKRWMKGYALAHHMTIPPHFSTRTNHWGGAARKLCIAIQHKNDMTETGLVSARFIAIVKPFPLKLAATAVAELGTREWPPYSNSGPVLKYLKSTGIGGGSPWCAAFVTWCMKQAGWKRSLPTLPAFVPSWDEWGRQRGYEIRKYNARRGDLVTFQWDSGGSDHIGIVLANYGPYKSIATVEGNVTSAAAPGGVVARKTRYWSNVAHVYRLPSY